MRMLPGILGIAIVPLAHLTLRSLGTRKTTATLGAALVIFENGLVTQSRLILLDSPLVFFTALTAFFWVRFSNVDSTGVPFSKSWWSYLSMTGLSLGAVVSCKWVGLFTIATVGLCVLRQLWLLLGNLKVTPRMWMRHFAARALCLIVVPSLFYMSMFQIHFWVLNRSGDGDGFMSSEFQHTLIGHGMEDTYAGKACMAMGLESITDTYGNASLDVSLGSVVSVRHVATQGGYLHSHAHAYPGGSNRKLSTSQPPNHLRLMAGICFRATNHVVSSSR
jgi:dolichyl-phosphate-mannose-protein mannosyltransferase